MERNIDRKGSSKPRAARNVRTFGDLIDLHDDDMHEIGKPLAAATEEHLVRHMKRTFEEGVCVGPDVVSHNDAFGE
jgi:hypothetical protein